ncbi:MAG: DUF4097 family beta strand repeat-containing protein [Terriglobales bacterium]
MATPVQTGPCRCPACRWRRISAPLVLIAVGVLLLAHMLPSGLAVATTVGAFLVFVGALGVIGRLLPHAAGHRLAASVFFPLLLLIVGVLVLARHALPQMPVGAWIANYWPLLLILWGLTRLLEHLARPARTRAGLSGGEVALVILIVVCGLLFSGAYHFRQSRLATYWGVNLDRWNPFLDAYGFSASARAAVPATAPPAVVVRGYRGDVTVSTGPAGGIAAALTDTVYSDGQSDAARLFAASQPAIREEGGQWIVLPAGEDPAHAVRANLTLTLPANAPLTVQIATGDITVPAWGAALDLHATHGEIMVAGARGNVQVTSGHGSVQLSNIQGNVVITGGGGDISVRNVSGTTSMEGEYVGSLHFSQLGQGLVFHSSRTWLELAALPGSLSYDLGEISIRNASNIQLRTRDVSIHIGDFRGPLTVVNRNDSVRVDSAAVATAPISITNRDADITLRLPASSRFHLQANARDGEVENSFGAAAQAPGPPVTLTTSDGTISVRSASAGQ